MVWCRGSLSRAGTKILLIEAVLHCDHWQPFANVGNVGIQSEICEFISKNTLRNIVFLRTKMSDFFLLRLKCQKVFLRI